MRINIVPGNLIEVKGDAIVNSADSSLLGGCGVDEAVHQAAGPELLEECRNLGGCKTGYAKITGAYGIRCKYIIHTVVPTWRDGWYNKQKQRRQLASCYHASLKLAMEHGCQSIAFPLLGTGSRGYPKDEALQIALNTIDRFLSCHNGCEMRVCLIVYNRSDYQISTALFQELTAYLRMHGLHPGPWTDEMPQAPQVRPEKDQAAPAAPRANLSDGVCQSLASPHLRPSVCSDLPYNTLKDMIENLDEGFSQTLLRLIDQKGMDDVQCYTKANIDRRLFSRIRGNPDYHPSKPTVMAFAVALELTLDETENLLRRAGYALSHANVSDVIVEFFISQRRYDIQLINECLYYFDQSLLGNVSKD